MSRAQTRAFALFLALTSALAAAPIISLDDGRPANPLPGDGIAIIAPGGDFTLYFVGGIAGYVSQLYLNVLGDEVIFTNDGSPQPARRVSGIPAGTELVFRLVVDGGRYIWFSGPGTGNADSSVHAAVCDWLPDDVLGLSGIFVGFEDLPGSPGNPPSAFEGPGDGDFNDLMFVIHQEVPEPSTVWLSLGSLAALAVLSQCRRRA